MYSNTHEDAYINRNDVLDIFKELNSSLIKTRFGFRKKFLLKYTQELQEYYADLIANLPAAEVLPNHYGMWVDVGKTDKGTPIHRCSYCLTEKAGRPKTDYCPDCGCQMIKDDVLEGQQVFLI